MNRVTRLQAARPRNDNSVPGVGVDFSLAPVFHTGAGTQPAFSRMSFADESGRSGKCLCAFIWAEVKNIWSYTFSSPYVFIVLL